MVLRRLSTRTYWCQGKNTGGSRPEVHEIEHLEGTVHIHELGPSGYRMSSALRVRTDAY